MPKTRQDMIDLGYQLVPRSTPEGTGIISELFAGPGGAAYFVNDGVISDAEYEQAANHIALHDKLVQARDYFSQNYREWATLTAAQKDAANRQAQRALANVCRHLLNDLSTPGD